MAGFLKGMHIQVMVDIVKQWPMSLLMIVIDRDELLLVLKNRHSKLSCTLPKATPPKALLRDISNMNHSKGPKNGASLFLGDRFQPQKCWPGWNP